MKHSSIAALLLGLLLLVGSVQAQQVWRCGADGRSFSDQPCREGKSLEAVTQRPAADVQAAAALNRREAALAESMRQERLQREQLPAAPKALKSKKLPAERPETRDQKLKKEPRLKLKRPADDGTFRAIVPASRRSRG